MHCGIKAQQKKQQEDFSKNLAKMQETNSKLQESLSKLTAQNTQAAKDLADAKDKARELEEQLANAKKGCAMPGCMGVIALVIIAVATACIL